MNWRSTVLKGFLTAGVFGLGAWLSADDASAHGYIEKPASRGYIGSLEKQEIGWQSALEKYGRVIDSPQSVEGPKGFPEAGPADGHIASAGGGLGQIDQVMDRQSADAWKKQDMRGGLNTFTWKYTAPHATSKWHYYITKKGWDPNSPLERSDFELIGTETHDGTPASNNLTHKINVPTDRSGYHVILGVWDVADTPNAFYNVIDVNLINDGLVDTEAPSLSGPIEVSHVSDRKVGLKWQEATDNAGIKGYDIYRNGQKIGSTAQAFYTDTDVMPETEYHYTIKAIDLSGNESVASEEVIVTTLPLTKDTESPSAPTGLHTMKVTESSVSLMWTASEDNVGVKEYVIYRDGKQIGTTVNTYYEDKGLQAGTRYSYTVSSRDEAENLSLPSSHLEVTTVKDDSNASEEKWNAAKVYTAGMVVLFNGYEYEAKYWTQGNQPDSSDAWKLLSEASVEWNAQKPYLGGDKVTYKGHVYEAKWWTVGSIPGASEIWILVEK
ncbi:lytic polysaccharide monooxygenase [Peribacillus muralis]|uniref:lytic polysaccharide monooxygenase n=1 Tax=Peribacillus muralis TaxID=264697 RepID=UPI003CFE82E6